MGISKKEVGQDLEILELMDSTSVFYEYDESIYGRRPRRTHFKIDIALKQYKSGVANMWTILMRT